MILTGIARIGRDAEIRYTPNGDAVCNLSLAFAYGYKPKDGGYRPSQWIDASLWGKRAESLGSYLTKGTMVSVVLEDPHIEEFEKRDGQRGSKLAARVVSLEFAGGGEQHESRDAGSADGQRQSRQAARPAPQQQPQSGFADFDDDIPF